MTDETLFAWTSVGDYKFYPQFVNVSRKNGRIVISVRSLEDRSGEHPATGAYATATLPDEEVAKLAAAISATDGAVVELRIGDPVECVVENCDPKWAGDWANWSGYVVGIQYDHKVGDLQYTVSDHWPPRNNGDLSDGFYTGQLRRALLEKHKERGR